jgi:hypothetical protein
VPLDSSDYLTANSSITVVHPDGTGNTLTVANIDTTAPSVTLNGVITVEPAATLIYATPPTPTNVDVPERTLPMELLAADGAVFVTKQVTPVSAMHTALGKGGPDPNNNNNTLVPVDSATDLAPFTVVVVKNPPPTSINATVTPNCLATVICVDTTTLPQTVTLAGNIQINSGATLTFQAANVAAIHKALADGTPDTSGVNNEKVLVDGTTNMSPGMLVLVQNNPAVNQRTDPASNSNFWALVLRADATNIQQQYVTLDVNLSTLNNTVYNGATLTLQPAALSSNLWMLSTASRALYPPYPDIWQNNATFGIIQTNHPTEHDLFLQTIGDPLPDN